MKLCLGMGIERLVANPRRLVGASAVAAGAVTLLVSAVPAAGFAYRSNGAHVAIETTAALVSMIVAVIVLGRFLRSRQTSDLLLTAALLLLAATNLVFSTLPSLSEGSGGSFVTWAPLIGRIVSSVVLVVAVFMPDRPVARPRRSLAATVAGVAVVISAIGVAVAVLGPVLPSAVDATLSRESSRHPHVVGSFSVATALVVLTLLNAVAAVGFTRRAERTGDELMGWLATGMVVAAFSRLNDFLFPALDSQWVYASDALRLCFYLLLLVGALREISAYQRQLASIAAFEERRRMARNLHDGVAQDLAFIVSQSARLRDGHRPEIAALIGEAADRALDESRAAVAALARPLDESISDSLPRTVEELARRGGASVTCDIDPDVAPEPIAHEALLRIAGEAVNNAVRHGGARAISVSLRWSGGLRMVVRDDGSGFDLNGPNGQGFGLTSMRERAQGLGGELIVDSTPGAGTTVEAHLP